MDYELDLDDPIGSLVDQADRFLSGQKDTLIQSFAGLLGQVLARGTVTGAPPGRPGPAPRSNPPPGPGRAQSPPPPPPEPTPENPRDVLGFGPGVKLTRAMVKERQRELAKLMHPDRGGSTKALQRLNGAATELLKGLK